jgi:predicted nucleic acid-binding protein
MLLDTNVLIDLLRGRPEAQRFILSLPAPPALSVVTVTELRSGVRTAAEQTRIDGIVATYSIRPVTLEIAERAGIFAQRYRASHGVDTIDALIAATSEVESLPLATLNLKHFPMFPSLARPY